MLGKTALQKQKDVCNVHQLNLQNHTFVTIIHIKLNAEDHSVFFIRTFIPLVIAINIQNRYRFDQKKYTFEQAFQVVDDGLK
jgi:hypothetical protein